MEDNIDHFFRGTSDDWPGKLYHQKVLGSLNENFVAVIFLQKVLTLRLFNLNTSQVNVPDTVLLLPSYVYY